MNNWIQKDTVKIRPIVTPPFYAVRITSESPSTSYCVKITLRKIETNIASKQMPTALISPTPKNFSLIRYPLFFYNKTLLTYCRQIVDKCMFCVRRNNVMFLKSLWPFHGRPFCNTKNCTPSACYTFPSFPLYRLTSFGLAVTTCQIQKSKNSLTGHMREYLMGVVYTTKRRHPLNVLVS